MGSRHFMALLAVILICGCMQQTATEGPLETIPSPNEYAMRIESGFNDGGQIPQRHTCDGQDISPPLRISEVPESAMSLVLIVDDPDAPLGTWVHWVVTDINASLNEITEGGIPGTEHVNSFRRTKYGGPCPPAGTHRYLFKLYALDTTLNLPETATKKDVEQAIKGHIIAQTQLMGRYARK